MGKKLRSSARILFVDLETFPNLSWTWGKYDQNVIKFKQQTCIATYAAKWLGEPVFAKALPDYRGYAPHSYDDRALIGDLWELLNEADVVVAHNGKDFDIKVAKARFIFHGLTPPAPFKVIDTKDVAKRVARFNSNKLDDLSQLLFNTKKIKTDFDLWLGCIEGDLNAWARMVRYNKKDVVLLERLYLRLLPWIQNHPNLTLYSERAKCTKCGSGKVQARGTARTTTRTYQRWQCQDCGAWSRSVKGEGKTERTSAE